MGMVSMPSDDHESLQPQPGGGWISGPATNPPTANDHPPAFNPGFLLVEIRRVLAEHGVTTNPTPGQLHVATIACGDVLRGLGVDPASVPPRRRS